MVNVVVFCDSIGREADTSELEGAAGNHSTGLLCPVGALIALYLFDTKGSKRQAGGVKDKLLGIDVLVELDGKSLTVRSDHNVVLGEFTLGGVVLTRADDVEQESGCLKGVCGIKQSLPSEQNVVCGDVSVVRPVGVSHFYVHVVLCAVLLLGLLILPALSEVGLNLTVFVESEESSEKKTYDRSRRLVLIRASRVEVVYCFC